MSLNGPRPPISALQCEWSLWWREVEDDVVPAARRLGVGLVAYSPLGRGFLTGTVATDEFGAEDFRNGDPRFAGQALTRNQTTIDELRRIAAERGVDPRLEHRFVPSPNRWPSDLPANRTPANQT